jgi:hypothetical protein
VIRYLALAFIFFQVATTTALATQVVLFESEAVEPMAMALAPPMTEMAGRTDGAAAVHLLIHIDNAK